MRGRLRSALARRTLFAGGVFILALALYLPSVRNGFAYDDHMVIRADPRVHDLSNLPRLFAEPYWNDEELGLYRPLASASYAIDWAVADGNPQWFHWVNTFWNAGACALLFLLLTRFVPTPAALLGALVFAVHPVHVEAVANVVGRAEVMAALFSIAAMLLWLRADVGRRHGAGTGAGIVLLFLLAVLSKESAIMLPALIALLDVARGAIRPASVAAWFRTHAAVLSALALTAVAFLVLRTLVLGELGPARVDPALDIARSTTDRILTALQGWPHVLRLMIFPRTLLSDYGPRIIMPVAAPTLTVLAGMAILLGLVAGGIAAWLRGAGRLAAVLLFLPLALLPTSNLLVPIGVIVAERTLYLPSIAVALAIAFLTAWLPPRPHRRVAAAVVLLAAGLGAVRTLDRIPVWRSTDAVFAALTADRPDSFRAQWYNARAAVEAQHPRLALERYALALRLWPYRHGLVLEASAYAAQIGDLPFTRQVTEFAVTRWPQDVRFARIHAGAQLDLADTTAARSSIEAGLARFPADSVLRAMQRAVATTPSR